MISFQYLIKLKTIKLKILEVLTLLKWTNKHVSILNQVLRIKGSAKRLMLWILFFTPSLVGDLPPMIK